MAIIRTNNQGADRSIDLLEHSVRNIEEFMAAPFPNGYVGLLFGNAVSGDSAGTYFGTHMAILARYDIDDDSYYADYAGHIIAHEVAHYYWNDNDDWVDEGASDFVASISENAAHRPASRAYQLPLPLHPYNRHVGGMGAQTGG